MKNILKYQLLKISPLSSKATLLEIKQHIESNKFSRGLKYQDVMLLSDPVEKALIDETIDLKSLNYYQLTGTSFGMPDEVIKTFINKLLKDSDPLVNASNLTKEEVDKRTEDFKLIQKASEILTDPEKREEYDKTLNHFDKLSLPEDDEDAITESSSYTKLLVSDSHPDSYASLGIAASDRFKVFKDIYEEIKDEESRESYRKTLGKKTAKSPQTTHQKASEIFGKRDDQLYEIAGRDKPSTIKISFQDAYNGAVISIPVSYYSTCGKCYGKGTYAEGAQNGCGKCGGTGKYEETTFNILGKPVTNKYNCTECQKLTAIVTCGECDGNGKKHITIDANIEVPAGAVDNQILRLTGLGEKGIRGGKDGDLIVTVTVEEDERFSLDLKESRSILTYYHTISYADAMLGTTIYVPLPSGEKEIILPELTNPTAEFTYHREGYPQGNGSKGKLVVKLQLELPKELTPELKYKLIALKE